MGFSGSGNGQFLYPTGIGVDSSDNIYVADFLNCRIQKFDSNRKYLTKWVFKDNPWSVAVSPSGSVYVSNVYSNCTQKFDRNGKLLTHFITKWGTKGSGNGQLNYIWDVAVDSSGNVYVADWDNRRIDIFAPYPEANFTSNVTSGYAPLFVRFIDKSTGSPTSWLWDFGDKSTSRVKNPIHKYAKKGLYTVSLTVKNLAGNSTKIKSKYVTVK